MADELHGESMSTLVAGHWLSVNRADPRAFALYRRHYSAAKNAPYRRKGNTNIVGPAEHIVLLSEQTDALFVWVQNTTPRFDGQEGTNCSIFRNESDALSSELIAEADELAWGRWPGLRHWTYVDADETERGRSAMSLPGQCFIHAGWQPCGRSKKGLHILERLPVS